MGHETTAQIRLLSESEWKLPREQLDKLLKDITVASLFRSAGDPYAVCLYSVLDARENMLVNNGCGEREFSVNELEKALLQVEGFKPAEKGPTQRFQSYLTARGFDSNPSNIIVGSDSTAPEISFLEKALDHCKCSEQSSIYICFS